MSDYQFSQMMMSQNKSNNDDSSDSPEKENKTSKFKTVIKFKPKHKNKNNDDNEKKSLKGMENKVKSLLSNYLRNIEIESINENYQNLYLNNMNLNTNILKGKDKKRFTTINKGKLRENYLYNGDKRNIRRSSIISMKNNPKNNKHKNSNITKKVKKKNANTTLFKGNKTINRKDKIKDAINDTNIKNKPYKTIVMKKIPKRESDKLITNNSFSKDISRNSIPNSLKSSFVKNENSNTIILKNKKDELFNKILQIQNGKSRNELFNESYHNSMISEGSECHINQKSFEIKNNKQNKDENIKNIFLNNNNINKNINLISKKNTMKLSHISPNNILGKEIQNLNVLNGKKNNSSSNMNSNIIKSNNSYKNNKFIKKKLTKNSSLYRSLKEKLKENIILRPEETQSSPVKKNTIYKKSTKNIKNNSYEKSNINLKVIKIGKMNQTSVKNINKTINTINLGHINKNEILKKNNSDTSNKKNLSIFFPTNNINTKIEENKKIKNNENESEQTLKTYKSNNAELTNNLTLKKINSTYQCKGSLLSERYRNLIQKKILYDSLDDEECDDDDDGSYIYIDPNSTFVFIFDTILFFLSMISFVVTPFYLAMTHDFCRNEGFTMISAINMVTEIVYICDFFMGFCRGYYNWEEQLVRRKRFIIKKYLTDWFIFDLISALPIYTLSKLHEPYCNDFELSTTYYNYILDNLNYILICNKLFKIYKVHTNNQAVKFFSNKVNDFWSLIYTVFVVVAALNYSACLYIFIGRNSYPNWILQAKLGTEAFYDIYICSIYILIMALTTVGYGDITCYSFNERIYQLFLLVIGIMAYSYAVSAFSNYVQKINEKSADFEKKKSILDEIKLSNPNLPEKLYDRILKHLVYKNTHEKKLKNLLFDCLPISLKNSLVYEMYKPIIKNFIFFKNFQNTDFIVRVILAFKAIVAYKNDILVNEGDMVEDIMFVKKGVLSVELPINLTNPQENIEKYLNTPLLKVDNIQKFNENKNISRKNSKNQIEKKASRKLSSNSINFKNSSFETSKLTNIGFNLKEINKEKIEKKYIKILGIRNNEHFGDVLMFLEQRSPLRLRVTTKKCELYFLKKIDAIKISTTHQNIWRRLNKKSIYNFDQIKKIIKRIVELYSEKKISENENSDNTYEEIISQSKIEKKEKMKKYHLNDKVLPTIKEVSIKKSLTLRLPIKKYFKNLFRNRKINIEFDKNRKRNKTKHFSLTKINTNYKLEELSSNFNNDNLNPSLSSSNIDSEIKKENKNSENNKNEHQHEHKHKHHHKKKEKKSNSNKKEVNNTPIKENRKSILTENSEKRNSKIKSSNKLIYFDKNPEENTLKGKNNNINSSLNNKNFSSRTLKIGDSSSMKFSNDDQIIEDNNESEYEMPVNKEIYPWEEIEINKENSLFSKKFNPEYPKIKINNKLNTKNNYKNSKIKTLLNSFEKENDLIECEEKGKGNDNNNKLNFSSNNDESISDNNINDINKIESNKNIFSSRNNQFYKNEKKNKIFESNFLSINKNISFIYESSYENCNLIAREKLIKNKIFQEKLKKFLLNEVLGLPYNKSNNIMSPSKKKISLIDSNHETSNTKFQSSLGGEKKENQINQNINNTPKIKERKSTKTMSLFENNELPKKKNGFLDRKLSLNEFKFVQKKHSNNFKNDDGVNNEPGFVNGRRANLRSRMSAKIIVRNQNYSSKDLIHKKVLSKKTLHLSPHLKLKKHQDDILSQIDFNIEKTNQNLNNPEEFYNNYFNYLLSENTKRSSNKPRFSGFFGPPPLNLDANSKK